MTGNEFIKKVAELLVQSGDFDEEIFKEGDIAAAFNMDNDYADGYSELAIHGDIDFDIRQNDVLIPILEHYSVDYVIAALLPDDLLLLRAWLSLKGEEIEREVLDYYHDRELASISDCIEYEGD